MTTEPDKRDAAAWAQPVDRLQVTAAAPGARNINVSGRRQTSPIQGFGRMWQKTYRVPLGGVEATPGQVIDVWKRHFPEFWPNGNSFFAPLAGIAPGEVAALDLSMPGGLKLSTGVLVLYADDESFTLMTPQGHMFAGWITFSAFVEEGVTHAQAQVLMRASDPMYELGMSLGGHGKEDKHWQHTLRSLAEHLGAAGEVVTTTVCVDRGRQWARAANIWHNAGIRSGIYMTGAPIRLITRPFRRGG
jgi:hypothetical protein